LFDGWAACRTCFRPAGEPRYGAVMERLFGTTTTQLFNNLEGNKELLKHFRSVTKSFQPKKHARWTMPAIHGALDFFYSRLYGKESHPAHGEPPVDFFDRRLEETGQRASRLVRYDRAFMIETCPSVDDRGTRVVDNQRGVKVDWVWYWSDSFRHVDLDRKSIEVRIDPWDPRHVYALVEDRWQLCRSKLIGAMRRMTALELQYACRTMEQSSGVKQKAYTLEKLQEWADVLKPENFDSRLRLEQQEMAFVYEPLKMTSIEFAANGKSGDALVEVPSIPKPQRSAGARPEPAVSTPSAPVAGFNPNSTIKIDVEAQIETF
jgi:putative transposase